MKPNTDGRGQVLVAIINSKADLAILHDKGWYRVPVASAPKRWPPQWLAFYQTKIFGDEAYAVRYYGYVTSIRTVERRELFPEEFESPKSDRKYYQIHVEHLETLPRPIYSKRWRRIVFISTTWRKFKRAVEINDLYDDSPLENQLWEKLKALKIDAERQYDLQIAQKRYLLDFAIFCVNGKIDVETDGDSYHANPERAQVDNERNNNLATQDWQVLRFSSRQVQEERARYCISAITTTINRLGGLSKEGLVPRKFLDLPEGTAQQLGLFDTSADDIEK